MVVLALWTVVLAVALPSLLVQDSWLDFVDGRLVVAAGLPHVDSLTLWTLGRRWTDQQWGAQVVLYELVHHGGFAAVLGVGIGCVIAALAILAIAARRLGGSPRATAIALCLPVLAAPSLAQLRAQTFALVLFAAVFALLALDARSPSRRVLWVLPLLVLWANLHGSVALGAGLACVYGLTLALPAATRVRGLVLAAASPLCLLASPYSWHLVGYYHLMLLDPPLEHYVQEWKPPELIGSNVVFFASAVAVAGLWIWRRSSLTRFELWALPLLELAAFRAVRNAVWFELAAVVALPRLVDRGEVVLEASVRRANVILGSAALAVAVVVAALALGGCGRAGRRASVLLPRRRPWRQLPGTDGSRARRRWPRRLAAVAAAGAGRTSRLRRQVRAVRQSRATRHRVAAQRRSGDLAAMRPAGACGHLRESRRLLDRRRRSRARFAHDRRHAVVHRRGPAGHHAPKLR